MRVYTQLRAIAFLLVASTLVACQQSEQAGRAADPTTTQKTTAKQAPAPDTASKAHLAASLGDQWKGRDGQRWNATAVRVPGSNEFILLRRDRVGPDKQKGTFTVDVFGERKDRLKIIKRIGDTTYQCDGLVSSDHRFISGVCFILIGDVVLRDHDWWVTVQQQALPHKVSESARKTQPEQKLNLNLATVEELEQYLNLDPEQARSVVDYKLGAGRIKSLGDLQQAGILSAKLAASLAERVVVR